MSAKPYSAEELERLRHFVPESVGLARWLATVDALRAEYEQAVRALHGIAHDPWNAAVAAVLSRPSAREILERPETYGPIKGSPLR